MSLVSICIPTYNGEKYLQEALDSVKAQTYKNLEVIISDDQSADNTFKICENFKNEVSFPVHIYSHIATGIGANWNNSIHKSSGKYIKMMFQDDVMEDNCIEVMMNFITVNKVDIVVSKRKIIDDHSEAVTSGAWYENYHDLQKPAGINVNNFYVINRKDLKNINFNWYLKVNIIGEPCTSLFSRKLFDKTGDFNTELKQILDYEYWLRVLKKFDIGIIEEKLIRFRVHADQASNSNANDELNEVGIIKKMLFQKMLFFINRTEAIYYLKQKYPLIKFAFKVKYKFFS